MSSFQWNRGFSLDGGEFWSQNYHLLLKNERNLTKLLNRIFCFYLVVIKGIGVDIEDISRFRDLPFKDNKSFYNKIFTVEEVEYCLSKVDPYQHFAVRFCAKEAFVKAQPTPYKIDYKSISILLENSKPFIIHNEKKYFLSLSHDQDKAVAVVIVQ